MNDEDLAQHIKDLKTRGPLLKALSGYWISQAVYVAAKLRLADALSDGPRNCHELAAATGTSERALYRLLRALAGIGVFVEDESRMFQYDSPRRVPQTRPTGVVVAARVDDGRRILPGMGASAAQRQDRRVRIHPYVRAAPLPIPRGAHRCL